MTTGEDIRAKIEANRLKRLSIAEAMKREAGVTGHEINNHELGGLAFIGTGRIKSPEGRNKRQLYTVAHECGHIFLHNAGLGYSLPAHVKEMEAESYAHQAFREHGMNLPREFTQWGRNYVRSWVEKDRLAGVTIDPRAEAYGNGVRSPYDPLRMVPSTWKLHKAARPERLLDWIINPSRWTPHRPTWRDEARVVLDRAGHAAFMGNAILYVALKFRHDQYPTLFTGAYAHPTWAMFWVCLIAALGFASLAVMFRTMTRMPTTARP